MIGRTVLHTFYYAQPILQQYSGHREAAAASTTTAAAGAATYMIYL